MKWDTFNQTSASKKSEQMEREKSRISTKIQRIESELGKSSSEQEESFHAFEEVRVEPDNKRGMLEKPYAEPKLSEMNLKLLSQNLGNCLGIIEDEVMKGYVTKLSQLPIIRPETSIDKDMKAIHFFKISELVYQEDEFSVDKLATVFNALSNQPCTLVLMLKSDGKKTEFYLGARPNRDKSAGTLFQMLKQSLIGFFPGSRITEYYDEDMKRDIQSIDLGCVSAVTCVADYKQKEEHVTNKDFIQGLEKFVYTMQGKSYTAILIADNLSYGELMQRKREYEQIYTQISPFANMQINFSVSDGSSSSRGKSDGVTKSNSQTHTQGLSKSDTETKSQTLGTSRSRTNTDTDTRTWNETNSKGRTITKGKIEGISRTTTNGISGGMHAGVGSPIGNAGVSMNVSHSVSNGISYSESLSHSLSMTLSHGIGGSHGRSEANTSGSSESTGISKSLGNTTSESTADTESEAFNLVNTETLTDTFGSSKGVTLNAQNMTLNLMLERIKKHLERIEECESFGMWNFAAYFLGESASDTETAANTYKAIIAGNDSGIERSAVNSWFGEEEIQNLFGYIRNFVHPQFLYRGFSYDSERLLAVNPSALVSTKELAIHMGLPRHSVRGLPVVEHAPFAQEVITRKKDSDSRIALGTIYHLGDKTETEVELDLNSLSMHTFITGSTGSGKSNAVYHLLSELRKKNIPFLVVEPAKGEYKEVFKDVRCFGTNPKAGELLKINPFSFPEEVHVLEHIDRIVEIFNVCWPMYAAMPAVLKDSIERAYISAGWELDVSENTKVPGLFPTFDDVLRELDVTIRESAYAEDTKGDYIGSLSTRLKSLTNGINGRVFVSDEQELSELFDKSAIIDISRIGSMETKSLIMGLVVLKLQEYRMAKESKMNSPLKHITVLEEAHNLLKKTSTEQSSESSNMVGKSVEMLTNAIAEIRTYGEGFVIVDQAPDLLDTAAIRNTNTKIVLRLPESTDRKITGGAISLKEPQFDELSKLPTGVAAVYQNDWQEAVLCALPRYEERNYGQEKSVIVPAITRRKEKNDRLLHLLLKDIRAEKEKKKVIDEIVVCNASAKIKKDLILNVENRNQLFEWAVADFIRKNYEYSDVFRGTGTSRSAEEAELVLMQNLAEEFSGFNNHEMQEILYCICLNEHEKYPDNKSIEELKNNIYRKRQ